MEVNKILEELRREREQIEEAILTLERLAEGRGRRRGHAGLGLKQFFISAHAANLTYVGRL